MQSYPYQKYKPNLSLPNPDYLTIQHLFYGTILQYRAIKTLKTSPITQ